jgi:hypothetical protein
MQPCQLSGSRECSAYDAGCGEPHSDTVSISVGAGTVDGPWLPALEEVEANPDALWILNGWLVCCGAWPRSRKWNEVGFYLSHLLCHPGPGS